MEGIPEDVIEKLKFFNESLSQFEDDLEKFLSIPYGEQLEVIFFKYIFLI